MSSSIKNYTEQGGARTVIGGELVIEEGALVTGLPSGGSTQNMVVLDLNHFNLMRAMSEDVDISDIINPAQFRAACSADFVSVKNIQLATEGDSINVHGLYTTDSLILAGMIHIPGDGGEIGLLISFVITARENESGSESVYFRGSFNDSVNGALGLSM